MPQLNRSLTPRLRRGGGVVADGAVDAQNTRAIRALNAKGREDKRVTDSLVSIVEGLLLARER